MSALGDYYTAQANEKNAGIPLQYAQAAQVRATTDQIDPNAAATRALQAGQTLAAVGQSKVAGSQAGLLDQQASVVAPDASSVRGLQGAQGIGALAQAHALGITAPAQANLANQQAEGVGISNLGILPKLNADLAASAASTTATGIGNATLTPQQAALYKSLGVPGYSKGGVVKSGAGPKPGKTDTMLAAVAPGEAILTKHTVDHYGHGVIAHMNAMGLMRHKAHNELVKHFKKVVKKA